jgi:hypothetical protein
VLTKFIWLKKVPSFASLLRLVEAHNIRYTQSHKEGVVFIVDDIARTQLIEYLVISPVCAHAHAIEQTLLSITDNAG